MHAEAGNLVVLQPHAVEYRRLAGSETVRYGTANYSFDSAWPLYEMLRAIKSWNRVFSV